MAKTSTKAAKPAKTGYRCTECGWITPKWVGRCGECQAWGTVDEIGVEPTGRTQPAPVTSTARPVSEIDIEASVAAPSGVAELDRVLGGGVVPGAALLLAGEPGVGKSTLLLEVAARWSAAGARTLYVSAEESAAQVRLRADRTGAVHDSLYLAAETDLSAVLTHIDEVAPSLLIIDSVQTIGSTAVEGVPGGVTQVREVAATLVQMAKRRNIATLMVGHVTKDGGIAGPRVLEHLVDVVLSFDGDRNSRLRFVRAVKNRFGPVDEVGCFDLSDDGIVEVPDPTGLFVSRHATPVPGTCVTVPLEGRRPLLAEVQSLVAQTVAGAPRRTTSGVDSARMAMIQAVLTKRCGVPLHGVDVYAATVGGARLIDPAADLAVALAIASAAREEAVASDLVAIGEVGLAGEVRRVGGLHSRLREAARIGFKHALVPADAGPAPVSSDVDGIKILPVADVAGALELLGLGRQRQPITEQPPDAATPAQPGSRLNWS
ncbi:DNA repair protein RadA [Nocardioidaceae bacterium SCSIO 66511]|nr:DNA repair protein RadA [Nocardioidaceae bacterium SCSIO 66511]